MKKIFYAFVAMVICASTAFAASSDKDETILKRYYGEKANNSYKNPCKGETVRICAEVVEKVTAVNGGYMVAITTYDGNGNVTNKSVSYTSATIDEIIADAVSDIPDNAEVTVSENNEAEAAH